MSGYLDHASSAPLSPEARDALAAALETGWADPQRLHTPARRARLLLDNARAAVAESLGVRSEEVSFTGSGTDAVHRGLLGLLTVTPPRNGRGDRDEVVLSAVEHSAVFSAARWWAGRSPAPGAREVREVPVDHEGRVRLEDLAATATAATRALAVQQANPEVATVQPLDLAAEVAGAHDVPLFVDACATAGLLPLPQGWDSLALSAHKWGGPAGVGVLLVRKGGRWRPPYPADDRSDPHASGFENVPAALAAAAALQVRVAERDRLAERHRELGERLVSGLADIPDTDVHGPDVRAPVGSRLPHVVSFSFLYLDGETLVHELDKHDLQVASGSACTSSAMEPSHVLVAMGGLTHGNVRVSFGPETGPADVDHLVTVLRELVPRLRAGVR